VTWREVVFLRVFLDVLVAAEDGATEDDGVSVVVDVFFA
jgi:hypothetical protein